MFRDDRENVSPLFENFFLMTTCHEETPTGFLQICAEQENSWDEMETYCFSTGQYIFLSVSTWTKSPFFFFYLPACEMWLSSGDLFCLIIQHASSLEISPCGVFFSVLLSSEFKTLVFCGPSSRITKNSSWPTEWIVKMGICESYTGCHAL